MSCEDVLAVSPSVSSNKNVVTPFALLSMPAHMTAHFDSSYLCRMTSHVFMIFNRIDEVPCTQAHQQLQVGVIELAFHFFQQIYDSLSSFCHPSSGIVALVREKLFNLCKLYLPFNIARTGNLLPATVTLFVEMLFSSCFCAPSSVFLARGVVKKDAGGGVVYKDTRVGRCEKLVAHEV